MFMSGLGVAFADGGEDPPPAVLDRMVVPGGLLLDGGDLPSQGLVADARSHPGRVIALAQVM
jgi:hypothetical protein